MSRYRRLTAAVLSFAAANAAAFPDGAPWGAALPDTEFNCGQCHFDYEAVRDSRALSLVGLPTRPVAGESYDIAVVLAAPNAKIAGLQMLIEASNGNAGRLRAASENIEAIGAAARSTTPDPVNGAISWALRWQLPTALALPVTIYVAAVEANHDGSPFGDTAHFRSFTIESTASPAAAADTPAPDSR